jgi:hypothetical protein
MPIKNKVVMWSPSLNVLKLHVLFCERLNASSTLGTTHGGTAEVLDSNSNEMSGNPAVDSQKWVGFLEARLMPDLESPLE